MANPNTLAPNLITEIQENIHNLGTPTEVVGEADSLRQSALAVGSELEAAALLDENGAPAMASVIPDANPISVITLPANEPNRITVTRPTVLEMTMLGLNPILNHRIQLFASPMQQVSSAAAALSPGLPGRRGRCLLHSPGDWFITPLVQNSAGANLARQVQIIMHDASNPELARYLMSPWEASLATVETQFLNVGPGTVQLVNSDVLLRAVSVTVRLAVAPGGVNLGFGGVPGPGVSNGGGHRLANVGDALTFFASACGGDGALPISTLWAACDLAATDICVSAEVFREA